MEQFYENLSIRVDLTAYNIWPYLSLSPFGRLWRSGYALWDRQHDAD